MMGLRAALGLLLLAAAVHAELTGCSSSELRAQRKTRGASDYKSINPRASDPRLPTGIKPRSYFVQLQPSLEHDTFRGHVFANISVIEARDVITLHASPELRVKHVTVDEAFSPLGDVPPAPAVLRVERDIEHSLLFVRLSDNLLPGSFYRFGAEFSGHVNTKTTEGLFKTHYVDQESGETHYYMAANFKPNLARTVFPCFDEPSMKAVITLSVARPKDTELRTISNMPHASTLPMINDPSWVWDTFEATPPISTFSLSFLTSDMVAGTAQQLEAGTPEIQVWSRAALTDQTAWARQVAPQALTKLEQRLHVRFPLPKLDLVALPGFEAAEPAENWGLVFYREGDILSGGYNRWVTNYVVAQVTRQWLGGLVTPDWWSEAWLNRALSEFVADSIASDLGLAEERALHEQAMATTVYGLYYEYSHRVPHKRQSDMRESIVTSKARVVINMLNSTLTASTMSDTLQDLLTQKQYSTYEQSDLWAAMDRRAHADGSLPLSVSARAVADSWMSNDRFPVLSVTRDYLGSLNLAQRVFLRDPATDSEQDDDSLEDNDLDDVTGLWWVPVLLAPQPEARPGAVPDLAQHRSPALWMPPTRRIDNLSDPAQPDRFLLVNPEEIGLVLVNYDRRNWALLADHLTRDDAEKLPPGTRAKLLHDALNLAMGSVLDFPSALEMTRFLATETRPEPWQPFFNMADHLLRKLDGTAAGKLFAEYVLRLVVALDRSDKEKGEGEGKLRINARRLLCKLGHEPCVRRARETVARWIRGDIKMPPPGTLCPVFAWGTRDEFKFGLEEAARLTGEERTTLLIAMAGCAREAWRLERLLNTTFLQREPESGEPVFGAADQRYLMMNLATSHSGYLSLFRFLQKNFDVLKTSFNGRPHMWTTMVATSTAFFKTYDELEMISEFARHRRGQFGSAEKALRRAMQRVELEASWSQRHLGEIKGWLMTELA